MFVWICTGVWQSPHSLGKQASDSAKTWSSGIIAWTFRSGRASGFPEVQIRVWASCGFSCCFFPYLSSKTEWQEVSPQSCPLWEKDGTEHGFLERCQSSSPLWCQETQPSEIVAAGPIHGACCREPALSEEELGGTGGRDSSRANWEATSPDSFKI